MHKALHDRQQPLPVYNTNHSTAVWEQVEQRLIELSSNKKRLGHWGDDEGALACWQQQQLLLPSLCVAS